MNKICKDCEILKAKEGSRSMGFSEIEIELCTCNRCLERQADREQERREFIYYHS